MISMMPPHLGIFKVDSFHHPFLETILNSHVSTTHDTHAHLRSGEIWTSNQRTAISLRHVSYVPRNVPERLQLPRSPGCSWPPGCSSDPLRSWVPWDDHRSHSNRGCYKQLEDYRTFWWYRVAYWWYMIYGICIDKETIKFIPTTGGLLTSKLCRSKTSIQKAD